MQLSAISFCDKIGHNIKNEECKVSFLKSIEQKYTISIIQRHFNQFAQHHIDNINKSPHMITYRSNGNPYLLFLTKYNNTNTCIFIDKKVQHGYASPRMILQKMWFDDSLFKGTIFDGEMVKTNKNQWKFLIHDLLVLNNEYLSRISLNKRIELCNSIFSTKYIEDDITPFKVEIKYFYPSASFQKVYDGIPKLEFSCRGIYFKPMFLKYKDILVNFDDSLIKKVVREKYKDVSNFLVGSDVSLAVPKKEEIKVDKPKVLNSKKSIFYIKKTGVTDVYEMFKHKTDHEHNCIACVNTLSTSKLLQSSYQNKNIADKVPFVCEFSESFKKWIPIREVGQ